LTFRGSPGASTDPSLSQKRARTHSPAHDESIEKGASIEVVEEQVRYIIRVGEKDFLRDGKIHLVISMDPMHLFFFSAAANWLAEEKTGK
jgi:hypothetical protein